MSVYKIEHAWDDGEDNNCVYWQTCEVLDQVDRVNKASYDFLLDSYLNRDAPFIVTDAMNDWPVMNTEQFYFENITQVSLFYFPSILETVYYIDTQYTHNSIQIHSQLYL